MKKLFALIFTLVFQISLHSQSSEYELNENIHYYDEKINQSDEYVKERCVLDLYYPKNVKDYPVLVWFHGGGLKGGNKEIPEALKEKGIGVVAVNYRLYPKVKSPKFIEDAAAAVAWVFKNINNFGGDTSFIFVSGYSAGGYLSLMIGLDKSWLRKHNIDANRIAGIISLSGQTITHFTIREERGISDTRPVVDSLAPLFHVRPDAPPLILITGDRELELLGRYEENAYLMRMMKIVGHQKTKLYELEGYTHDMTYPAFPLLLKEVQRIVEEKHKSR
ncbi:MAG: alpha/beta hydrolase [Ignavibacterium sp.]|nr:alpha/beta hydrolase [Ignavibacterium sp.]